MVKKTCHTLESLNSDFQARISGQITNVVLYDLQTDAKNRTLKNSAFELTNPLEMVKKTCHALESLNSDFRARI